MVILSVTESVACIDHNYLTLIHSHTHRNLHHDTHIRTCITVHEALTGTMEMSHLVGTLGIY
jgi:hypothetical protein